MHLREPDALADGGLRELLVEAQPQDRARALVEARPARSRRSGSRSTSSRRSSSAPSMSASEAPSSSSEPIGRVERAHAVGAGGVAGLEQLLDGAVEAVGELGGRRRAAELELQRRLGLGDLDRELLQVARHAQRPRVVAEVAADLARDRRDGVAGEAGTRGRRRSGRSPSRGPSAATCSRSSKGSLPPR